MLLQSAIASICTGDDARLRDGDSMSELPQFIRKASFLFTDDPLRPTYWLAGGSILSMMKDARVNDYDLFSPEPPKVIAWFESKKVRKTFENDLVANFAWDGRKV